MNSQKVKVSRILRLEPPTERLAGTSEMTTVHLSDGDTCLLDAAEARSVAWQTVLKILCEAGIVAYLETDSQTNVITRVQIARTVQVSAVAPKPVGDRHKVVLMPSHAPHFINTSHPNYQSILEALSKAQLMGTPVLVTTEEPFCPAVIDVRSAFESHIPIWSPPGTPATTTLATAVTPQRAQELFNLVSAQSCNVVSTSTTCIPFLYPDNQCWARAHQMCRLMIEDGVTPLKYWHHASGGIEVLTRNSPICRVRWEEYHVAPFVEVQIGASLIPRVIDPALFTAPVDIPTWLGVQATTGTVQHAITDSAVFKRKIDGTIQTDDAYIETTADLATARAWLAYRSTFEAPPGPPYSNCP